ncbi:MAG: hypothetical protein R3Y19_08095 [Rikenellaceae bacterium]
MKNKPLGKGFILDKSFWSVGRFFKKPPQFLVVGAMFPNGYRLLYQMISRAQHIV